MKHIIDIGKRSIIVILALCILLSISATCLNVTAMAVETTATAEETAVATEDTTVVTEESTQELVPMMARSCDDYGYTGWDSLDEAMNHYGTDFTYTRLSNLIIRNGNVYTHYYTFSDGRRMYFGVI